MSDRPDFERLVGERPRPRAPDLTIPLLLGLVVLLVAQGFQTVELLLERGALATAFVAQGRDMQAAAQVRGQLEGLLGGASSLAGAGNANAAAALAELGKQGITYTPPLAR